MKEQVKISQNLITILEENIKTLIQKVDNLTRENIDLRNRLLKYEHLKNSNNSSVPPSKDENRPRRKSLREKSGLKPGGQKGRKGNTLKMVEEPNFTEKHIPLHCDSCGENLENNEAKFIGKRQVFDIPKIEIKITEHQIYSKQCKCGQTTECKYPQVASAPASYGNNIESLIGYFHARLCIFLLRGCKKFLKIYLVVI